MKWFTQTLLFAVIITGIILPTYAQTITIVADEWAPYNSDPQSQTPGYGIEIAKQIYNAKGFTIDYKILSWNRALDETEKGKYNAVIGATKDDAPTFVFPQEEIGQSINALFVKKGSSFKFAGVGSLKNVKVGIIDSYSYGDRFDAFFKANPKVGKTVSGDDALEKNIKKLIAGRIDTILEDPNVFMNKATEMGLKNQVEMIKSEAFDLENDKAETNKIYIAFSPHAVHSKQYAAMFDEGIKKIRDSGELNKILAKYGLADWKK